MPAMYTWKCPPASEAVTSFTIEKSTDDGVTWSAAATIAMDTTDPLVYDPSADRFFWTDPTPASAEIVRIAAVNAAGTGPWRYSYGPPARPSTVNVFGAVLDPVTGRPMEEVEVIVYAMQGMGSAHQPNPSVPSNNAQSVTVASRRHRLFTDREGRWSIDLVRDVPMEIEVPAVGLVKTFRLPTDEGVQAVNFRDLVRFRIAGPLFQGTTGKGQRTGVADGPLGVGAHIP